MKAQQKLLLVAVLSALAGVAYAADTANTSVTNTLSVNSSVSTSSSSHYNSDTYIDVDEVFDPKGGLDGLAEANITNVQKNLGNTLTILDPSNATVDKSANKNAGNVGVNNASGFFNNQDNQAAIAKASGKGTTAANAKVDSEQLNHNNTSYFGFNLPTAVYGTNDMTAKVTDSVNDNAGNVGVNNAAGASNLQANKMAISSADNAALASAHSSSMQVNMGNSVTSWLPLNTTATVSGSANGNAGNVGLNNAAGVSNAQLNSLSMATSSK